MNIWPLFCGLFYILEMCDHYSVILKRCLDSLFCEYLITAQWSAFNGFWLISSMVRFQFPLFCGLYPNQVALIWYIIRLISSVVRSQIVFSHYSAGESLFGMVFQFLLFLRFLPCVLFSIFLCDRMYPSYDLFLALITLLNIYIELW